MRLGVTVTDADRSRWRAVPAAVPHEPLEQRATARICQMVDTPGNGWCECLHADALVRVRAPRVLIGVVRAEHLDAAQTILEGTADKLIEHDHARRQTTVSRVITEA